MKPNSLPVSTFAGSSSNIIASNLSFDDFMAGYDEMHVEWVNGNVIKMEDITFEHHTFASFFRVLLDFFLERTVDGRVLSRPFLLNMPTIPCCRAPDVTLLLAENMARLQQYFVLGSADLIIEVTEENTHRVDYVEKFLEYEKARVREYWIVDWQRTTVHFNVLGEEGMYQPRYPDENGIYHSVIIPQLALPVAALWQPEQRRVTDAMLAQSNSLPLTP